MEVKEKSKKRELIKTVAIVFLVVLLLLTFFSNTIMNRSLPEVATQAISSGTINARIRGNGTVAANESYEVIINQTREVRSVNVRVGDTVSQGDVLFVLGDVESEELKAAQENLDSLNLQYQQQLLTLSRDYATEDRAIQKLREDLQKAIARRDANSVTAEEITSVESTIAVNEAELVQIDSNLEALEVYMSELTDVSEAKAEVSKWEAAVEAYEEQLEELETTGTVSSRRDIEDAEDALAEAEYDWQSLWMAYAADLGEIVDKIWSGDSQPTVKKPNTTSAAPQYITKEQQTHLRSYLIKNGTDAEETIYEELIGAQNAVESKEQALERLLEDAEDVRDKDQDAEDVLEDKLSDAKRELRRAKEALEDAEDSNAALKEQVDTLETIQRDKQAMVESLNKALDQLETRKSVYDAAVEEIADTERAIQDALTGKNIDRQLDDLSLQELTKQIEKAKAQVEKYTADSVDTEIKANVSGRITEINVSPGKENVAGSAMAVIDVVDRGYIIKIPVTNEQSRQVRVGDTADVTNYYWGNELEATLEAITSDPSKPGSGKLLVFRVTGEVEPGTNITLSIGQRSANYDTIIPKSALREDTNGYFVLVITVKSTPLSNRYIATRVDVQVLAEDDTSAAVSGLSMGDFVITTASKPVEAGAQVRMVEDS